jgi:biotin operon repressor
MRKKRGLKVRDFRNKGFFLVDDTYLNGYAKHLGTTASMVYLSLCRHADKEQSCFPPQKLIAKELGINERTAMEKINLLEEWGLIEKLKKRNTKGRWVHNVYYLLDKSVWKTPPTGKVHMDSTRRNPAGGPGTQPPTSKQHIKDTHIIEGNTTAVVSENVDNVVGKILRWAYEKNPHTPSCPREAYRRSLRRAIDRVGLETVWAKFLGHENAIGFLVDLKNL